MINCNNTKKPVLPGFKNYFLVSTINLIAVLSSPSISISLKAGTQIKSFPVGALTIPELQEKAKLTLVSATSIIEGGAHDVVLKDKSSS